MQGGWDVVFAESEEGRSVRHRRVLRYWYGELDAAKEWRGVAPVRGVAAGTGDWRDPTDFVRRGGASVFGAGRAESTSTRHFTVYRRNGQEWLVDSLGTAAYMALGLPPDDVPLAAVVRPDRTERRDANSIFLYQWDDGWTSLGRIYRGFGDPAHEPMFVAGPVAPALVWISGVPGRPMTARVLPDPVGATADALVVDTSASSITGAHWRGSHVLIVQRQRADAGGELVLSRIEGRSIEEILVVPDPFFFPPRVVRTSSNELLLIGEAFELAPDAPPIAIVRLSIKAAC